MNISRVLIDNGSALNICLAMTLGRIGVDDSMIRLNGMMVQVFDGTKTSACGEVNLKFLVGPCELEVPFVMLDNRQPSTCSSADPGYT